MDEWEALLSAEEEIELAQRIEAGVLAQAVLNGDFAADADARELRALVAQGEWARQRMWLANQRLARMLASRWAHSTGLPVDDLVQEAHVGLADAIMRFDHQRGIRFSTVAWRWIGYRVRVGVDKMMTSRRELVCDDDFGLELWAAVDDPGLERVDDPAIPVWVEPLEPLDRALLASLEPHQTTLLDELERHLGVSRATLYRRRREAVQRAAELYRQHRMEAIAS